MLNEKLKLLREKRNFKQHEIAKALNISTACYNRYETGKREPSLDIFKKLCEFYNVSSDYLLDIKVDK